MATTFERAFNFTRRWEGGFVNDPADPGGATNYGISLRFLRATGLIEQFDFDGDGDLDVTDIRNLSEGAARSLYLEHFWSTAFAEIPSEIAGIKLFDFGVNMGPRQRNRLAQRALNEQIRPEDRLLVDGILGPQTRRRLEHMTGTQAGIFVADLEDQAARFYFQLAERRRASRKFLFGWLRRCYDRPEI